VDIDDRISLAKRLIAQREEIDTQLAELFGGVLQEKRQQRCRNCGESGHSSRTCPKEKTAPLGAALDGATA
jgi:hypothetical protein